LTLRNPIVRRCLAVPITCCLLVTMLLVEPATAEEGIAAGSGAVITAGAPLAVRAAPGWDAAVSYEIADGTAVTVWDVAQAAPDGSLWYPVDGGFVPIDAVSSVSTLKGDVALYQDTTQDAATGQWVDPALADPAAVAAPEQVSELAATEEWVDPAAAESSPETTSTEALAAPSGAVDPATSEWTDPAPVDPAAAGSVDPVTGKSFDPATVEAVAPAAVDAVPVDAAPSDAPAPVNTLGTGDTEPWGEPIATAYIAGTGSDGAPCLTAPDWASATLAVLGEGDAVPVRAETMGEWQPVDCAGAGGYVHWKKVTTADEGTAKPRMVAARLTATKSSTSPCVTRAIRTSTPGMAQGPSIARGSRCTSSERHSASILHTTCLFNMTWGARLAGTTCSPVISSFSRTRFAVGCRTQASISAAGSSSTPRMNRPG
jgi:hypothetical protein